MKEFHSVSQTIYRIYTVVPGSGYTQHGYEILLKVNPKTLPESDKKNREPKNWPEPEPEIFKHEHKPNPN